MIGARVSRIAHAGALLLSYLALGSCSDNSFSGDAFPVHIDRSTGAVMVQVRRGSVERDAVLDIMAPITVFDRFPVAPVRRRTESLTVLGLTPDGGVPRAVLSADVFDLHPCGRDEEKCTIGGGRRDFVDAGAAYRNAEFGAVIGADALAGDAVRFDFVRDDLYILPDVAGGNDDRTAMCDAVFPSPFRGGGTVILDGAEVTFGGRRVAIGACLNGEFDPVTRKAQRGADALFVASTGIGITVLGASAYERLRAANPDDKLLPFTGLDALGTGNVVRLASGQLSGNIVRLKHLALVATLGSNPRGPCNELRAHQLLRYSLCTKSEGCPCDDDKECTVPAVVTLDTVDVMVVRDDNPTLQALRAELRPDEAEVDGILGTQAMAALQIDIDYPHNRVLARCAAGKLGCFNGRQMGGSGDADEVEVCNPPPPDAGVPAPADAGVPAPTPAR